MKRIFAILITLIGGGITAYNLYAAIADRTYFAKGYAFSSVVFIAIGLTLLLIGIRWNINLTKNPDAGETALKNIGLAVGMLAILAAGIALTILLVSAKTFSHSAIVIGFIPVPGQVFYAAPIVASILTAVFLYSKRK